MLRNTFMHLCGVGEHTERRFWERDWHTWDDLLAADEIDWPSRLRAGGGRAEVDASFEAYAVRKWRYFEKHLPAMVKWRAFEPLRDRVLYVDIETDGMTHAITVIGIYDGRNYRAFIEGENLADACEVLEQADVVVTYNGTGFDMPIIQGRFPYHLFNHVHIDLMWPLRRLGFKGGLKHIEKRMGLSRSEETHTMSGWDAVILWQAYRRGHADALDRLLKYNEEDVRNLEPLMAWVDQTMRARIGLTLRP